MVDAVQNLFIENSAKITTNGKQVVNTESPIFKALALYGKDGYWATSEDISHLGGLLGVETEIQVKGQAAEHPGTREKEQPTIILLNDEKAGHWTTLVPESSVKLVHQQADGFATLPVQEMSDKSEKNAEVDAVLANLIRHVDPALRENTLLRDYLKFGLESNNFKQVAITPKDKVDDVQYQTDVKLAMKLQKEEFQKVLQLAKQIQKDEEFARELQEDEDSAEPKGPHR
ncbi:MAG: hypothetical protein EBY16_07205 [Gammaproteobacteria bacterium]|nr:hypothetical protein [Gammaproteobacteria bacterium]